MEYLIFKKECTKCNEVLILEVLADDIFKWKNGLELKLALPYLSCSEKHMLDIGLCKECYKLRNA